MRNARAVPELRAGFHEPFRMRKWPLCRRVSGADRRTKVSHVRPAGPQAIGYGDFGSAPFRGLAQSPVGCDGREPGGRHFVRGGQHNRCVLPSFWL